MEFRKIQYFESVARYRNFTKAAQELHVAQPTITTAIKKLEEELGVPLFVRDKRSVVLTCEGEIFLEKVKDILQRIDQVVLDMQDLSDNMESVVNLGIVPISGAYLTSLLYKELSVEFPYIRYKILEIGSYGILDAIEEDKIDMGYLVLKEQMEEKYEICRVKKVEMKVLMNLNNPLACKKNISVEELKDENLIYFPEHSYVRQKMDAEFMRYNIHPKILALPVQMITVYNLVQRNAGISFSVGDAYESLIRTEDIVAIPLKEPVYCEMGFVWKKGKVLNRAARKCLNFVVEQSKKVEF